MKQITAQQLHQNRNDYILIDVREADELAIAALDDYIHIPMNQIPNKLDLFSPDKQYAILCRSGGRSGKVTQFLQSKGIDAYNVEGGILAYKEKIDPTLNSY